jgi:phosphoribosylamine-glycine ligase
VTFNGGTATRIAYYSGANAISSDSGFTTNGSGTLSCVNITATSDERLKTNIRVIENALDKVDQLRGVLFTRISNNEEGTGVIAQDLLPVIPEAVAVNPDGYYSVAYGNLAGLLIEAVKELKKEINLINKRLK